MRFATFTKMVAVAGVLTATLLGQSMKAMAEEITMGYTKATWQAVDPLTRFAADVMVNQDGTAAGAIRIHKVSDVTLKRGVIDAQSGAVVCDRNEPVMVLDGTYYEEIGGQLVAQGRAHVEVSRPAGGGGGDIIVFDIVGVASQTSAIEAVGRLSFDVDPCR